MRVFPSLCLRARTAGASTLHFMCELETMNEEGVSADEAWSCTGYRRNSEGPLAKTYGRSGEEALRKLVDKLEAS